jgi:hypothetical protein
LPLCSPIMPVRSLRRSYLTKTLKTQTPFNSFSTK